MKNTFTATDKGSHKHVECSDCESRWCVDCNYFSSEAITLTAEEQMSIMESFPNGIDGNLDCPVCTGMGTDFAVCEPMKIVIEGVLNDLIKLAAIVTEVR